MTKQAPLILVDGSSYLYRAFHAMYQADLRTADGRPTGAVRGVVSMLRRLAKDYDASDIVVIFDAKGKTFRDELYDQYKANRPPMPDDLREQIEPLHQIIKAMGLPLIIVEGVEADDVIGTLTSEATDLGRDVVVSTGDKDMAQLVNKHVVLINTMTDTRMDSDGVLEKFGILPEQIIDYLALVGDKVDNIPGVEKCGPKTAVKWLDTYGSLKGVMENAELVKGKIGENLRAALEHLPLSYVLATIKTDVELDVGIKELKQNKIDVGGLKALFDELEFKSWSEELDDINSSESSRVSQPAVEKYYDIIFDKKRFLQWIERIQKAEVFAFDTETTSLNYMEARLVGVSFSDKEGHAAYIPFAHDYVGVKEQLDENFVLEILKPILEDENIKKVGQNLKYDKNVLANYDICLRGIAFDTMIESYVLNSTANRHDMDTLAKVHLDEKTIHFEDIAGKGAKQLTFNQVAIEQAGPYAAEDADITLRLHNTLWSKLEKNSSLSELFNTIELPLLSLISKIERQGALIDSKLLGEQSQDHAQSMERLQKQAFDIAGEEFNLSSPKQLAVILFEKLKLPIIKKTPKGAPSTAEEVLQELALDYPLPKILMEYRSLSKLKSTYTDKLPAMINKETKRVHTSYHQAVTATGRLSSADPNLQNIPIKTSEGRRIRQAFIAPKGYKLIAADYSQIELRIMAHLSKDKNLNHAFIQNLDIHKATAAEVFDVELDQVSMEQRRSAKAINFGLIYGMSAFGLAKQLHMGRNDAQHYIDMYFERYPGVAKYMDDTRSLAREQGYVETIMGRRLYLPDINASNGMRRQGAERTAINAPMQGTAADIIKIAMLNVDAWLEEENVDAKIIMQVHDELVLEARESESKEMAKKLCEIMSNAVTLSVPLLVEAGIGNNWDEAH